MSYFGSIVFVIIVFTIISFLGYFLLWFFPKIAEGKRTYDRNKEKEKEIEERNRYIHFRNSLPSYDYDCDENGEEIFFYDLDSIDDK